MQTVYCSNSIFKDVAENPNKTQAYQIVYSILDNYSDVVLDLEDAELEELIMKNEVYNYFNKRDVGKLESYKALFENIENEDFSTYPTEIFLLDNETIQLRGLNPKKIRDADGCLLLNYEELDLFRKLNKPYGFDFKVQMRGLERKNINKSWEELLHKVDIMPINTVVLTDSFIYKNRGDFNQYKYENLYAIIQNIIPAGLEAEFQIIIVIDNSESVINIESAKIVIDELTQFIEEKTEKKISVGIITHTKNNAIHERAILSNHHYFYSDKGFNICLDRKIKYETKGRIEWLYQSVSENSGTIRKDNHFDYLTVIKKQRDDNEGSGNILCFNKGNVRNRLLS